MLKIKWDINQQDLKTVDLHFVKSEIFSLTWSCGSRQRDTTSSENSDWIIWRFKGYGLTLGKRRRVWTSIEMALCQRIGFNATPPPPPSEHKTLYKICTMLDQRRRRWADVVPMLYKCFVLTGSMVSKIDMLMQYCRRWTNINTALLQYIAFAGWSGGGADQIWRANRSN